MSSPSPIEPAHRLTPELASQFARIALSHVAREYPSKLDHVLAGPEDVRGPRELQAQETPWPTVHQPLAEAFAQRFRDFLPLAAYPIRTGVHSSTAFALALASDYACAAGDGDLLALFEARARDWHLTDRDAQAW